MSFVSENEIGNLLSNLNARKSSQKIDIPIKKIKDNLGTFSQVMTVYFNDTVHTSKFSSAMKLADFIPVFKKNEQSIKVNYRPVSLLPIFSKILKKICMIKFWPILLIFHLKINMVSVKVIAPNIVW